MRQKSEQLPSELLERMIIRNQYPLPEHNHLLQVVPYCESQFVLHPFCFFITTIALLRACQRVCQRVPRLGDLLQVVALFALALVDFHELVLAGGMSRCLELSMGKEDLLTLDVPALQNHHTKDQIEDPTLVVMELLYLLKEEHTDQNAKECDDEHDALANLIANLKIDVDKNKKIQKQLKKANASLTQELNECKSILAKTSSTLGESNSTRDSCLIALQSKQTELETFKTLIDRTIDYDKLKRKEIWRIIAKSS
nr:hypothetical protein [Tanacetum cinerariifolium]